MTRTRLVVLAAAIAGGWVPLSIAASQSIALRLDELHATTATYSLIVAAGWASSMVTLPMMGYIGDRSVRRGIDRRIFIGIGIVLMLICYALLGSVGSIITLAVIWMLAQIPTSMIVTASSARLAVEAPADRRGLAGAAAGAAPVLALTIGAITTLMLSDVTSVLFIAPALVGAAIIVPSLFLHPTALAEPIAAGASRLPSLLRSPWMLLTAIALAFSGLAVGRIYLVPLIESVSEEASEPDITAMTSTTLLLATIGALIGTAIAGRLMREGRRSLAIFGWCALISALPLALLGAVTSTGQVVAVGVMLGLAIGAINAATYGIYLHRYSTRTDSGRLLGLIVGAETIPYVIVPLIAAVGQQSADAALISTLFAVGAALAVTAAVISVALSRRSRAD